MAKMKRKTWVIKQFVVICHTHKVKAKTEKSAVKTAMDMKKKSIVSSCHVDEDQFIVLRKMRKR